MSPVVGHKAAVRGIGAFARPPLFLRRKGVLGSTNVSVFYQPNATGFQVVAAAATDKSNDVIRLVCTLMPGQEAAISVPRPVGQSAIELRLHRCGDVFELLRPVS